MFCLSKVVLNRIDSIRRNFLWGKGNTNEKGMSLINWGAVCIPRSHGGMGASNLELRNIALVLRWWWKAYTEPSSLWTSVATMLRGSALQTDGPKMWLVQGSFFWQQLIKLKRLFHWCTRFQIGDWLTISYWYDNWNGTSLRSMKDGQLRPAFQAISLREAADILSDVAPDDEEISNLVFTQQEDILAWRWSTNGVYSASSVYRVMITAGLTRDRCNKLWKIHAPAKVKIFTFLLFKNRLLTHEVLENKGISCDLKCVLCDTCHLETSHHLFFTCSYARRVWTTLYSQNQAYHAGQTLEDAWDHFETNFAKLTKEARASRGPLFMAILWHIWRQRNERIFRGKSLPYESLVLTIREEASLWKCYCSHKGRDGIG